MHNPGCMFILEDALTWLDKGQNRYPLNTCKGGWKERDLIAMDFENLAL